MDIRFSDVSRGSAAVIGGWRRTAGPLTVPAGLARRAIARWRRPVVIGLALGGAIMGIGGVLWGYALGMWPPHDTSAYWLAGRHLIEGTPVYGGGSSWYLAFLYSPPLAIVAAAFALLPYHLVSVALVGLQLAALRYLTGSWIATAMLGWIPWVRFEFVAGNVDCLMAATIYAALTRRRGSAVAVAVFAFAKFSPALVLVRAPRSQWVQFTLAAIVLLALTLPVLHLWPEWITKLAVRTPDTGIVPLPIRLPVVAALLLYRRPWSIAAAAALATPIFYAQSIVLLLPAVRLWWDERRAVASDVPATAELAELEEPLASTAA